MHFRGKPHAFFCFKCHNWLVSRLVSCHKSVTYPSLTMLCLTRMVVTRFACTPKQTRPLTLTQVCGPLRQRVLWRWRWPKSQLEEADLVPHCIVSCLQALASLSFHGTRRSCCQSLRTDQGRTVIGSQDILWIFVYVRHTRCRAAVVRTCEILCPRNNSFLFCSRNDIKRLTYISSVARNSVRINDEAKLSPSPT